MTKDQAPFLKAELIFRYLKGELSYGEQGFVEPGFPFISLFPDARKLGGRFLDQNVVTKGLVISLGDSTFACFDRDLLRWSVPKKNTTTKCLRIIV